MLNARAELKKLVSAGKSPAPVAAQAPVPLAQASDVRSLDTKAPSEAAFRPTFASVRSCRARHR